MNSSHSYGFAALLASHPLMGVLGMVAGWAASTAPLGSPLCTAADAGTGILQVASIHLREHAAMYLGMAFGNLISTVVASLVGKRGGWVRESGRGTKCFIVMSIGMVLGSLATGDQSIALARWLGIAPAPAAMLMGMLFAVLVERLTERACYLISRTCKRPQAWLRKCGFTV
jgi:hypothetical protein